MRVLDFLKHHGFTCKGQAAEAILPQTSLVQSLETCYLVPDRLGKVGKEKLGRIRFVPLEEAALSLRLRWSHNSMKVVNHYHEGVEGRAIPLTVTNQTCCGQVHQLIGVEGVDMVNDRSCGVHRNSRLLAISPLPVLLHKSDNASLILPVSQAQPASHMPRHDLVGRGFLKSQRTCH